MAEKKECSGSEKRMGSFKHIYECASKCKGVASMFVFGTNDFGVNRCDSNGCECYCETSATVEGTCSQRNHEGFNLYKYNKGDYQVFGK